MKKLLLIISVLVSVLFSAGVTNKGYLFPLKNPTYVKNKIVCSDWCSNIRVENGVAYKYMALNYPAEYGTAILAPADGIVENTSISGYEGGAITLRLDDDVLVTFCHLSEMKVLEKRLDDGGRESKTRVKRGQVIGYVGTSGRTTGSHLRIRFEINGDRAFANATTWGKQTNDFAYGVAKFKAGSTQMYKDVRVAKK